MTSPEMRALLALFIVVVLVGLVVEPRRKPGYRTSSQASPGASWRASSPGSGLVGSGGWQIGREPAAAVRPARARGPAARERC